MKPKWWNGRHVRFRCVWRNPWGFKSPLRQIKRSIQLLFYLPDIGFQDCCDGSYRARIPKFRANEADL